MLQENSELDIRFEWEVFLLVLEEPLIAIPIVFLGVLALAMLACWKNPLLFRFFLITLVGSFLCFSLWFAYIYSVKVEMKMADIFVQYTFADIEKGDFPVYSESVDDRTRKLVEQWMGKNLNVQRIQYYGTSSGGVPYYMPYEVILGDGTVLYCKIEIKRATLLRRDLNIKEISITEVRQPAITKEISS